MMDNLLKHIVNIKVGEKMRELTMSEREKLVNILHKRYVKASKKDKTKILDEFVQTTGYNRSYAAHLLKYCESNKIDFTRSRKYKKNDNSHVEQKNWSVVRRNVGCLRYDTPQELKLLNKLYGYLRLYNNHFQSSMKLIEKVRNGSKVTKRYDNPATPYERVLNSKDVPQEKKEALKAVHETLDLYDLKRNMVKCVNKLFKVQEKKKMEGRHLDSVKS